MMAIDAQLAVIFRLRQDERRQAAGTSEGRSRTPCATQAFGHVVAHGTVSCGHLFSLHLFADAKRNSVNLKFKALDLLELFVRREEGSALLVGLILPLYQTAVDNTTGANAPVRIRRHTKTTQARHAKPLTSLALAACVSATSSVSAQATCWAASSRPSLPRPTSSCLRQLCKRSLTTFSRSRAGCRPPPWCAPGLARRVSPNGQAADPLALARRSQQASSGAAAAGLCLRWALAREAAASAAPVTASAKKARKAAVRFYFFLLRMGWMAPFILTGGRAALRGRCRSPRRPVQPWWRRSGASSATSSSRSTARSSRTCCSSLPSTRPSPDLPPSPSPKPPAPVNLTAYADVHARRRFPSLAWPLAGTVLNTLAAGQLRPFQLTIAAKLFTALIAQATHVRRPSVWHGDKKAPPWLIRWMYALGMDKWRDAGPTRAAGHARGCGRGNVDPCAGCGRQHQHGEHSGRCWPRRGQAGGTPHQARALDALDLPASSAHDPPSQRSTQQRPRTFSAAA